MAVYVPTNHLYLGDIVICRARRAVVPDITVEQGIRIFLTGGMALPASGIRARRGDDRVGGFPGIIRCFVQVDVTVTLSRSSRMPSFCGPSAPR